MKGGPTQRFYIADANLGVRAAAHNNHVTVVGPNWRRYPATHFKFRDRLEFDIIVDFEKGDARMTMYKNGRDNKFVWGAKFSIDSSKPHGKKIMFYNGLGGRKARLSDVKITTGNSKEEL